MRRKEIRNPFSVERMTTVKKKNHKLRKKEMKGKKKEKQKDKDKFYT